MTKGPKMKRLLVVAAMAVAGLGLGSPAEAATYMGSSNGRPVYCIFIPTPINKGTVVSHCGSAFYTFYSACIYWPGVGMRREIWRIYGIATKFTWGLIFNPVSQRNMGIFPC